MKYKVGDKANAYLGESFYYKGTHYLPGAFRVYIIRVNSYSNSNLVKCEFECAPGYYQVLHVKQLRRLKPKQKPVAREFWIMYGNRLVPEIFTSEESAKTQSRKYDGSFIMRVREVLQNPTSNEVKK